MRTIIRRINYDPTYGIYPFFREYNGNLVWVGNLEAAQAFHTRSAARRVIDNLVKNWDYDHADLKVEIIQYDADADCFRIPDAPEGTRITTYE